MIHIIIIIHIQIRLQMHIKPFTLTVYQAFITDAILFFDTNSFASCWSK